MFSDSNTMLMGLLIFLAAGTLAFSLMAAVRVRGAVKKRTRAHHGRRGAQGKTLALAAVFEPEDRRQTHRIHHQALSVGKRREHEGAAPAAVQAGIYDPRGVAFFFIARTALAIGLAAAVFMFLPLVRPTAVRFSG